MRREPDSKVRKTQIDIYKVLVYLSSYYLDCECDTALGSRAALVVVSNELYS